MRKNIITAISCIFIFTFVLSVNVSAVNSVLSTEELTGDKRDTVFSNVQVTLIEEEPKKDGIECFDVNTDQMIAIGQEFGKEKIISVYSPDGIFQYGYVFESSGSFCVEWSDENLNIILHRSSLVVSVDQNGEILDIVSFEDTPENFAYLNDLEYTNERIVGDKIFKLKNDMGILNYISFTHSQLVVENSDGEETILYDYNSEQTAKTITIGVVMVIFFGMVAAGIVYNMKNSKYKLTEDILHKA